jgi:hypothetical protein
MSDRDAWTQWLKSNHHIGGMPAGAVIKSNTRVSTNKYQARSVRVDGILFDSQREADRYQELKLLAQAGRISSIEIHPGFPLIVKELHRVDGPEILHTVGMYHADFRYRDHRSGAWVVEDVKSQPTKTEAYKLRKKIVEAVHGVTIVEIT